MPHIVIEYTPSMRAVTDIDQLVEVMHHTAVKSGYFPVGGARTWAIAADSRVLVGDGAPDNGFVFIGVRVLPGRSQEMREAISRLMFESASAQLDDCFSRIAMGLQVEVSEFAVGTTLQRNNMLPGQSRQMLPEPAPVATAAAAIATA